MKLQKVREITPTGLVTVKQSKSIEDKPKINSLNYLIIIFAKETVI
jgi:hypothetical protein